MKPNTFISILALAFVGTVAHAIYNSTETNDSFEATISEPTEIVLAIKYNPKPVITDFNSIAAFSECTTLQEADSNELTEAKKYHHKNKCANANYVSTLDGYTLVTKYNGYDTYTEAVTEYDYQGIPRTKYVEHTYGVTDIMLGRILSKDYPEMKYECDDIVCAPIFFAKETIETLPMTTEDVITIESTFDLISFEYKLYKEGNNVTHTFKKGNNVFVFERGNREELSFEIGGSTKTLYAENEFEKITYTLNNETKTIYSSHPDYVNQRQKVVDYVNKNIATKYFKVK